VPAGSVHCVAEPKPSAVADAVRKVTGALPGGGEARPGQLLMAEAVAEAMLTRRHVVIQAGTGTGKSLAYLVPALLLGEKVVVATATRALMLGVDAAP
jgi:ATP-dependent DNA helicase DinG